MGNEDYSCCGDYICGVCGSTLCEYCYDCPCKCPHDENGYRINEDEEEKDK